MRRPHSLTEVASWTARDGGDFSFHLKEFLDQFYLERRAAMFLDEPARLAGVLTEGEVKDAYLAAVAVSLARLLKIPPPAWAWDESRKLRSPWFASHGSAIRATLLLESPAPFRERNLFVSENALSRA
ncbi:MAG: hypothetical protein HYZ36_03345 [Pedosphaera parvula]|nr:hypothetical protein [Verrucomicrobiota bacterium]MBI3191676.1 hypothetical protein [Pedosphaera parvula]